MELLQAISRKNVFKQENKSHPRSPYLEELLTLVMLNKDATPTSNFQPIRLLDPSCWYKFTYWMTNSADPDQLASSEANWSGSTLFAKAGYIWVQQDKG